MNPKGICLNCGNSVEQCKCDFSLVKRDCVSGSFEHFLENVDFSNVNIQVFLVPVNANVAPANEYEYFQQIGDE